MPRTGARGEAGEGWPSPAPSPRRASAAPLAPAGPGEPLTAPAGRQDPNSTARPHPSSPKQARGACPDGQRSGERLNGTQRGLGKQPEISQKRRAGQEGGDGAVPIQAGHQPPGGAGSAGSAHPSSNPTISGATGTNRRPEPAPAGNDGLPSPPGAGPTPNTPLLHHEHPPAPPHPQKFSSPVVLTCPSPVIFTARTQLCLAQLCLPKSCVFRRFHAASPHPKRSTNLQGHTMKTIS